MNKEQKQAALEAVANHRKLWTWLFQNPEKTKYEYPLFINVENPTPLHQCYLCEYGHCLRGKYRHRDYVYIERINSVYHDWLFQHDREIFIRTSSCNCPVDWTGVPRNKYSTPCTVPRGLYHAYNCAHNLNERSALALKIRNLPICIEEVKRQPT